MNNKVIFEIDGEIDFRNECATLPGGSTPVAAIVNSTLVFLGSPTFGRDEIVQWVCDGWGFTVTDMAAVKSGRGNFFPLVKNAN